MRLLVNCKEQNQLLVSNRNREYTNQSVGLNQKKLFQYHNLSALPLSGDASYHYLKQLNNQLTRSPNQYNWDQHKDKRIYQQQGPFSENRMTQQERFYLQNYYEEDFLLRFKEFQAQKLKEREKRIYEELMNQKISENQLYLKQGQEKTLEKASENQNTPLENVQNHNQQDQQQLQNSNIYQQHRLTSLPPIENINFQKYRLNESLENPKFTMMNQLYRNQSEVFPNQKQQSKQFSQYELSNQNKLLKGHLSGKNNYILNDKQNYEEYGNGNGNYSESKNSENSKQCYANQQYLAPLGKLQQIK